MCASLTLGIVTYYSCRVLLANSIDCVKSKVSYYPYYCSHYSPTAVKVCSPKAVLSSERSGYSYYAASNLEVQNTFPFIHGHSQQSTRQRI
jgi:hypothetical protein